MSRSKQKQFCNFLSRSVGVYILNRPICYWHIKLKSVNDNSNAFQIISIIFLETLLYSSRFITTYEKPNTQILLGSNSVIVTSLVKARPC